MVCLKYELIKLVKKKMFLLLSVLLLSANLFTIYISEKSSMEFTYIFEQRDNYRAFLAGNEAADSSGLYVWDMQEQEKYTESYAEFITGMSDRVEQMSSVSVFSDPDSYVFRNMQKTREDFKKFEGQTLKTGNCFGVRAFAEYPFGVLFTLTFLAVLIYYVIFYERDMNLLLLVKGTRKGHVPTAAAKLLAVLLAAAVYTLLQESLTFIMFGILYGYGDMSRLLPSISVFRNCSYLLTIGEAVAVMLVVRVAAAMLFACVFYSLGMFVKNEAAAVLCSVGILAVLFLFSRIFTINGTFGVLACVNPFYTWDMVHVLGEYHNLNLAGLPVGKNVFAFWTWLVVVPTLSVVGIFAYTRTCQIRSESRLEHFMQWIRSKTAVISRRSSLLYYEFYKIIIQQKKGIVFLVLLIIGIQECVSVFGTQFYANVDHAAYHFYMSKYEGRITDEVLEAIDNEETYLDGLAEEMMALGPDPKGADLMRQSVIQNELGKKEQGFFKVQLQLDALKERPGSLYDKYLVDEMGYQDLWNDPEEDVTLWLTGSLLLLLFVCGIRTIDEKRRMTGLLRSTRFGREKLERSQISCAVWCVLFVFLCMELPVFLRYVRSGLFLCAGQRMSDFTIRFLESGLALWTFASIVFGFKFLAFLAIGMLGMRLARTLKSELPALLAGAGVVLVIAAIFYRMNLDIELILLQLL